MQNRTNAIDNKEAFLLCKSFAAKRGILAQKKVNSAAPMDNGTQLHVSRGSTRRSGRARRFQ